MATSRILTAAILAAIMEILAIMIATAIGTVAKTDIVVMPAIMVTQTEVPIMIGGKEQKIKFRVGSVAMTITPATEITVADTGEKDQAITAGRRTGYGKISATV